MLWATSDGIQVYYSYLKLTFHAGDILLTKQNKTKQNKTKPWRTKVKKKKERKKT